ncbi:DMT family transporter [Laspinema olomoucense]|uniref:DMT family transporter n=1 Tax=Laspinema olomoucense TaxID=3231600 RepID=UPI0021BAC9A0|nr:DMT family transporter [Laspinema sp. D3d]MCT7972916.1 DMT family transporter [Laspinema sp. D3d]
MTLENQPTPLPTKQPMKLHESSGRWRLGLGLSLVTVILWGVLPIALKITVQALDIYTVTWFRFSLSFGILFGILGLRQQLPSLEKLQKTSWKLLAIATGFLSANYALYLQGLAQTSPANAQVFIQLAPVLMGLGAIAIFKEPYTLRQWAGLGILTLGFVVFFHEQLQTVLDAPGTYLVGNIILVIAAAAWAVYALAQKQLLQQLSSSNIMLLLYGICALLFLPFSNPINLLTLTPLEWGMLIFCGVNTVVAYGAFAESLAHWDASKLSAVMATTPIVTLIAVWVISRGIPLPITPEELTVLAVIGAMLVVSGSVAIALGKRPPSPRKSGHFSQKSG